MTAIILFARTMDGGGAQREIARPEKGSNVGHTVELVTLQADEYFGLSSHRLSRSPHIRTSDI